MEGNCRPACSMANSKPIHNAQQTRAIFHITSSQCEDSTVQKPPPSFELQVAGNRDGTGLQCRPELRDDNHTQKKHNFNVIIIFFFTDFSMS